MVIKAKMLSSSKYRHDIDIKPSFIKNYKISTALERFVIKINCGGLVLTILLISIRHINNDIIQ